MNNRLEVHETAFVTATYRASNATLSGDPYSHLWKNPKTDRWIAKYVQAVSPEEPFVHCLRNRYFLDTINRLIGEKEIGALINFGCGFSMYPFLLSGDILHIEIDKPELISYKKQRLDGWMQAGQLPEKKISYIGTDFQSKESALVEEIRRITGGLPTFILLEGVLFFLNRSDTLKLLELFAGIQADGGYWGSVSFLDTITDTECFQRLARFYEQEMVVEEKFEYQTLPNAFYSTLQHYELLAHEDYVSLSHRYAPENRIENGDEILNEHMYILRKR